MTEPQTTDSPYAVEDRFRRLVAIMARLRAPGGCPWDREQTHKTLTPYLIEEAYEVKETLDQEDFAALREELGDLALQIVFHAQLASEAGRFDIDGVLDAICEKLIRRHPHVFGEITVSGSGEVLKNWEEIKKREKADKAAQGGEGKADADAPDAAPSILAGVPPSLPSLLKAHRIQEKVAHVGFDWTTVEPIFDKIHEEIEELREALSEAGVRGQRGDAETRRGGEGGEERGDAETRRRGEGRQETGDRSQEASESRIPSPEPRVSSPESRITDPSARARVAGEIGDLLFSIVNLSRRLGVPAEEALDMTNRKFMARFRRIEQRLHALGKRPADMTLEQLDAMWDEVKREE